MSKIKIVIIDDEDNDLEKYSGIFSIGLDKKKFIIEKISFGKINSGTYNFENLNPDTILIDQQLFISESKDQILDINGVTLSMHLRQKYSDVPIFIFTNDNIPNIKKSKYFDSEGYIDEFFLKSNYADKEQISESLLIKISEGYQKLREKKFKSIEDIINSLNIPEDSFELILEDLYQTIPEELLDDDTILYYQVAKWIRKILMKYPGILYDEVHAATYFGISVDSFKKESIQDFFKTAKYSGPFSNEKNMWWKSELSECANNFMDPEEFMMPYSEGFQKTWQKKNGIKLDPAVSIYNDESPADYVCCVLNKPVMMKYTLKYHNDNRPSVMDEARISFKAIYDDIYNSQQIDPDSKEIYDQLF